MPSKEQIEKAAEAIREVFNTRAPEFGDLPEDEQKKLASEMFARAALSAAEGVKVRPAVKPLAWDDYRDGSQSVGDCEPYRYEIYATRDDLFNCIATNGLGAGRLATGVSLNDAKAAAQVDYEARILSALQEGA